MTEQEKIDEFIRTGIKNFACGIVHPCDETCGDWSHFGDGPCNYHSDDPEWHEKMVELAKKRDEALDLEINRPENWDDFDNYIKECSVKLKRTYLENLKDPLWQRKRLEILNRDGFRCQFCNDDKNTLTVHHKIYRKNSLPWEYEDHELITLCEPCHKKFHNK
jgi:5-methylcytosine-specific restriction endonuclease McrA